ncbi:hypothetical protein EDD18DRAFT_1112174 [Armillaria luteobubalina]|uniref:Uncharacterized protein n=1 Tax=Armillaria luteobubalina TaxID=153913 RepID=A0AA39UCE7_9AGAR|nr:hypothetical protein EDD18DRAFT_1112174 [Armillaria luteobubalina]
MRLSPDKVPLVKEQMILAGGSMCTEVWAEVLFVVLPLLVLAAGQVVREEILGFSVVIVARVTVMSPIMREGLERVGGALGRDWTTTREVHQALVPQNTKMDTTICALNQTRQTLDTGTRVEQAVLIASASSMVDGGWGNCTCQDTQPVPLVNTRRLIPMVVKPHPTVTFTISVHDIVRWGHQDLPIPSTSSKQWDSLVHVILSSAYIFYSSIVSLDGL